MEIDNKETTQNLKDWLIGCGQSKPNHIVLVRAISYEDAIEKIKEKQTEYDSFYNATIE